VERLAWHAHEWSREHSPRHVERRIKSFSGRSLREWQAIVRTEGLFFAARDLHEAGQPFDWAALALDEGFADQAHMTRTVRRITGFTPTEFARRFIEDESFWLYRLWA
jgi:AraC-like DNA-binding protein